MRIAFSGCKSATFVSKSANFAHQLRMLAQQFEQDDGGLVRLGLAAFIFRKRTGSTAEDTTSIGLAKMKLLAPGCLSARTSRSCCQGDNFSSEFKMR